MASIKVKATQRGFDGFALREEGTEFELDNSKFQPEWMELLEGDLPVQEEKPVIHDKSFVLLICEKCGKDFKSSIALTAHSKHCKGRLSSELRTDESIDSELPEQG